MKSSGTEPPTRATVEGWSPQERAEVARMLDQLIERPAPGNQSPRRRIVVLAVTGGGVLVLFPWIAYLSATLQVSASGGAWRTAWVGFDVMLAVMLGVTGWLVWHRRHLAISALSVCVTLLTVDAWFDVCLSWGTSDQWVAVASAVLIELPAAALLAFGAATMLRRTFMVIGKLRGTSTMPVSLWKQQLVMYRAPKGPEQVIEPAAWRSP